MAGYVLATEAETDLGAILDYIADDNIESAIRVLDRFLEVFRLLAENPRVGHYREDLTSRPVRFFPVYSYMVVYLANTGPVEVVRVVGAAQNVGSILN